jgi:nucleotide-binding universal stress UspA family protein
MYNKILVPLDGSKLAECALEHVKAIGLGCHVAEVVLFRVVEPNYSISDALSEGAVIYTELISQVQKEAELYINEVTERFKMQTGIEVKSVLAFGNAANEILNYANNNGVDLIIMASHGRSGMYRWLLGNVTDKVSHHATVPVLIVTSSNCRSDNAGNNAVKSETIIQV